MITIRLYLPMRLPRRGLEEPLRFGAHGFGHATGLAVGPDDAPVVVIDPRPFELEDLGHARGEFELKPDREEDEGMLKSLHLGAREVGKELLHLAVGDQPGLPSFRKLRDVAARVRPVGAHAPDLGHV